MNITRWIMAYGATAIVFLACDAVWLTLTGDSLYRPVLGDMLRQQFDPTPAAAFYLLYIGGLVHFATVPAIIQRRAGVALVQGGLFGFFAYATYDLTNQATLRVWSTVITLADMGWGTVLSATAATLGSLIIRRFTRDRTVG
jgi:uncharacterized membrane protein